MAFTPKRKARFFRPSSGQKPAPVHGHCVVKRTYCPAFAQAKTRYRTAALPPEEGTKPSLILTMEGVRECVGDTRRRWLVSPSDCPADHLPAPAKAGVGVDGDLSLPGQRGSWWPDQRPEHRPQLHRQPAPEGLRAGPSRLRALPPVTLGGDRKESPFAPLLLPGRPGLGCRTTESGDFTVPSTVLRDHASARTTPAPTFP